MKTIGIFLGVVLAISFVSGQDTNDSKIWEVFPGDNYRAIYSQLKPGDQLVFHEGTYSGSAGTIVTSGTPEKPIIIRGYGNGEERPILFLESSGANLLQIRASHIVLEFLEFQSKYTYAIRIGSSGAGNKFENITVKNCLFYESGGGDISANVSAEYDNIHILNNYFIASKKTPLYIGVHDGKAQVTNFIFRGNVIDGTKIFGEDIIGYGIQLKLNVTGGIIENNYITGTKGPGIMVYGSEDADPVNANIVRNNIVVGSRNSAGIVVGGGPSVITNNVTFGCNGGITVQNYGGRNLLRNIILNNNTAVLDRNHGISMGNMSAISAQNNMVITSNSLNAYKNNPNPGINNLVVDASEELKTITQGELLNVMPAVNNLEEIWQHIVSGPLNQANIIELAELILEYKILLGGARYPVYAAHYQNATEDILRIYPNPASDKVSVELKQDNFMPAKLSVYTITGKQLLHTTFNGKGSFTFNVKNLDPGLYLVKVNMDGTEFCKKLILK